MEEDEINLKKLPTPRTRRRAEEKAADLDLWVKRHVAERRAADEAKKSRLKELRLAFEALREGPANHGPIHLRERSKSRVQRIWISGAPAAE